MKDKIKVSKTAGRTIASMQVRGRWIHVKGDDGAHARRRLFMATRGIRQASA